MKRSLNKIFSVLLVLCMLISMMPAVGMHQHAHAATSSTLFLKPNSEWLVDGARFAAYFFGNGEKWVNMTGPDSNGYYKVSVPSGYPSVIFCRMNGGASDNNWDNKWNQTADLTIPTSGECCWTLNSGDWGGGGNWSHLWNSGSVTKAATCTATGTKTYTCSLCSATKTESIAATGHSYTTKVTAPTCTAQGYTTHTCSKCGDSYKDTYKDATGHSYTSTVTKAATCTATGTKKYTCSKCSHSYTETIAKLGHSYTAKVTAPTCTAQGYTTHTCSRCSDSYKDTYTAATGHSYSNGVCTKCGTGCSHSYTSTVTKAATCTTAGTRKYTCSNCSYSYTESIAKLGHDYSSKVTAPTCTANGYTTYTCSRCSDSYTGNTTSATGHSYSSTVTKAATCTATGTKKYTCSKCSNSYTETIAKLGHNYTTKVTSPTCTAQGYTTHTCSRCSDSYQDSYTDATGHSYSGATCSACGATRSYYLFGFINGANYACEEDAANIGSYKFVNNTLTVTFTSDSWVAVKTGDNLSWYMTDGYPGDGVTSATLYNTNKGINADKLYVPGGTEVKFTLKVNTDETLKLSYVITSCDHTYTSKVTKAATCTAEGVNTFTCSKCADSYTEAIPATGHSYSGSTCSSCGNVRTYYLFGYINGANYACEEDYQNIGIYKFVNGSLTVSFTSNSYVAVKTGDNNDWYMTNGYPGDGVSSATLYNTKKEGLEVNKLYVPGGTTVKFTLTVNTDETLKLSYTITSCSHNYSSEVTKEPTCTATGTKKYTCSICGDSYTESVAAVGHKYTDKVTAPTCTAQGYTTHTCSVCGDSYKDSYKDATGHSWSNGKCSVCGTSCSHSYTSKVTKEPTCTATGTRKYTCSTCAYSYTESIAALGHSYKSVVTKPTCTEAGYTTYTCSTCGDSYTGNATAATGHSYGSDGKCTVCGDGCAHNYGSGTVTKQPTCTSTGTRKYTCSICGGTKTESIAATGHSYTSKVTAPTCTAQGYTTYTCSACGDSYKDSYKDATGHSYTSKVTKAATCTAEGVKTFTCSCGDSYTEAIPATGHSWSAGKCSVCGTARGYYLFGYINGANYACEEDATNIGIYKFENGKLTVKFDSDSYVAVKTGDNQAWYMTDGYPGDDATSAKLYNTASGIEVNKLRIPGGAEVVLSLTVNSDDTLVLSYTISSCPHNYTESVTAPTCTAEGVKTYTCSICDDSYTESIPATGHSYSGSTCTACGNVRDYYLFGFINGANYACEEDYENMGIYKFVNGKLTVKFDSDSYVAVKTTDNGAWYMTNGYPGDNATTVTLYNTATENIEVNKLRIPGGAEVVLSLKVNTDETLVLSYTITSCSHNYSSEITKAATCTAEGVKTYTCSICADSYTEAIPATGHSYSGSTCTACGNVREYYLFGYINGANYACEEDADNIGTYKFVNGKLTVTFTSDSYVAVKTGDNNDWYMTNGYPGDGVTSAKLYNTKTPGLEVNKLYVPGGTKVVFTLQVNTDETLELSYTITSCSHNYSSEVTKEPTCTATGTKKYTCSICGDSYTEEIAAIGHSYNGTVTKEATCAGEGIMTYTCKNCGDSYTVIIAAKAHNYVGDTCTGCGRVREYYLFGFINGANYGCEEDAENIGIYKFVNGKLTVKFDSDSYVAVKTGDNQSWYMTNGYPGDDATSATLYNTTTEGIEVNKLRIPGGAEVVLSLKVNTDETLVLSYTISNCSHNYSSEITKEATCTTDGVKTYTCSICNDSYTETISATGHSYSGGKCTVCGEAEPVVEYYLFGFINGANYACEEDSANIGTYKFVNGQLTVTFTSDSYVAVKTGDNLKWYMTEGYDASATAVKLYNTAHGIMVPEKMFVPGNVEVTFTLTVNSDDTLNLSYTKNTSTCDHISHNTDGICTTCGTKVDHTFVNDKCSVCGKEQSYYLFGFINGANYACEEDEENIGTYKFENGKLTVTFTENSYVGVKTGDNLAWYMAKEYITATSGTLYRTSTGASEKMLVPGGVEVTFTLKSGADDTLILSYQVDSDSCAHASHGTDGKCTLCGTAVEHTFSNGSCTGCGKACDHAYVEGKCSICGLVCVHGNWTDGTCADCGTACDHVSHNTSGICVNCGAAVEHHYVGGVCTVCGDGCAHSWANGVCSKCGSTCDHTWSGGSCTNCGMTSNGITVHFVNTLGWNGVVAYAWEGSTDAALTGYSWPGAIINRDADGYYTVVLNYTPASGKSLGLIFHNWNGGQTADLTVDYATLNETREIWVMPSTTANSEGKYDCTVSTSKTGLVLSPEVNGTSVTFRYQGSATSVYLAGSMNAWSATATKLTKGSDGVWSVTLTLQPGVYEYKFVVDGEWVTDPNNVGLGGYDGNCTVVVPSDDTVTDTGKVKVVLHFYRESGDYDGWDVWFWCNESSGSVNFTADTQNKGMIATYTVDGATNLNLGYTVRKSDWSDKEFYDRFIDLSDVRSGTVHYYLNSGSASGLRVLGEDVISASKISYANYNYEAGTVWVKTSLPLTNWSAANFSILDENGNASGVSVTGVSIDGNGYTLTLSRALSLTEACSFQVKYGSFYCTISYNAHNIFYSDKFASEYTYHGDDLGATWSKSSTTFKVWAPTAKKVYVKIFDSGNWGSGNQVQYVAMKQGGSGTWYVTVTGNLSGYYYNYDVVFPSYTVEATDPYAKACGANGDRGMILDFDTTDPAGWDNDVSPNKNMNYTDAIIYEMHIREMTIDSSSGVKDAWKGKYLGLTQTGTSYEGRATGLDHLKELGITHVQLMPVFDMNSNSVDEYHLNDWAEYSWGYNPKNYSCVDGAYSTDPFNGATRITEFKQMVQTLHSNGINVVMDVVYNHTFDGGNYCGNQIVPNYYSRFYGEGNWSNGSGCGNDLATERSMVRNMVVDSIMHWVEEYHIDGFRFDLVGLLDTVTVNEIVNTVHAKYPYVIFYGEGWAAGGTAVQYGYNLADKGNAWEVGGFGFFNDDFRNAIAGDNGKSWGFATGSGDYADRIANYFRASNGWSSSPSQTINYVSCHDNYCLMDKIILSRGGAYWDQMARMNSLSTAMVMLSQGIPFIYSGDELLREKKDEWGNRYHNETDSDYVNKIRWSDLASKEFAQRTDDYYAGLIAFRKNHAALRCPGGADAWGYTSVHSINSNTILVYVDGYPNYECSDGICMIFNGSDQTQWVNVQDYVPHGYYQATIHGTQAGNSPLWGKDVNGYSDAVGVEPFSVTVLVKGDLVHEESVYNQNMGLVNCSHSYHTTSGLCTSCGVSVSHSYSGGSCSVCGLSQSAPETYTVYYDNSTTGWGSVNAYAWAEAAGRTTEFTDSWPGTAMTDMGDGIYAIELPIAATNVIFNDGYGSQSSNLSTPAYNADATMYDPASNSWVKYEASCKHESHNTAGICTKCGLEVSHSYVEGTCSVCGGVCDHTWASGTCYTCGLVCKHEKHNTSGKCTVCGIAQEHTYTSAGTCSNCGLTCNHSWNGNTCNICGYVCGHTSHTTSAMCTYCGSDVEHSYTNGACGICGLSQDAPESIVIYFDNSESAWENVYAYAWAEAAGRTVMYTDGWPGTAMTLVSGDIYAITLPLGASTVIFNNGSGSQTGNETIPAYDSGLNLYDSATYSWTAYDTDCVHQYESVVTAPTCTTQGYTTHTCKLCGVSFVDSVTDATGHSYVDGICTGCGIAEEHKHSYEAVVTEPTCTEGGCTTYTCSCGDSYVTDVVPSLGHDYQSVVTAPTCTEPGYTTHTCSVCGDSFTSDETAATGHSYVDGTCSVCGEKDPDYTEPVVDYYLFGYINGANYACEEDGANLGIYKFVDGKLTVQFDSVSYVAVKTGDNLNWYMTNGYPGDDATSATLYNTASGIEANKLCVPGGVEVTFTLVDNGNDTFTLSYVESGACSHDYYEFSVTEATCTAAGVKTMRCSLCADTYDVTIPAKGHSYSNGSCTACGAADPGYSPTYYLFGYINGANYGCEEDGSNIGTYKFTNGKLVATFDMVSYVAVKTGDNAHWYMTDGYPGDDATSAKLYDTAIGIDANKMRVPGGVQITFTLKENSDGSLTLSFVAAACSHSYDDGYVSTAPGCTTTGVKTYTCTKCGATKTETIAATGHNYVDGACVDCGDKQAGYVASYYLFGFINGANYGCEEDYANMGEYRFVDGKLTATFESDSYIAIKTSGNVSWYMAQSYIQDVTGTFYNISTGAGEKMFVPGGVELDFTLIGNGDDSLTLTYVVNECAHQYEDIVTAPGCTEGGYTTHKCRICGDAYVDSYTDPTGHSYELVTHDATCISYADYEYICPGCGDSTMYHAEDYANWVSAIPEGMPASMFESKTEYRYRDLETVISREPNLAGYNLISSQWVTDGTETIYYVKDWSSGFDTGNALYSQYNNIGNKVTAYETDTEKVVVDSDEIVGYLYFHWCYSNSYYSQENKTGSYVTFHAYYSTTAPSNYTCDYSDMSYKTSNTSCCTNSNWFFVDEVYGQTYTTSHQEFTYECWSDWSDWSEEAVSASWTREVEQRTMYRLPNVKLGEHDYEAVVTAPTCTAGGYTTHTCKVCGESYVDGVTDATGHSYVDGICTGCGIVEEHKHSYEVVVTAPTCTKPGYTTHTCSCGDSYTSDETAATGHSYVNGTCSVCGEADPDYTEPTVDYYLFGWINGANYACEEDWENLGQYKFVNGTLTATFEIDSYIAVKDGTNTNWYMTAAFVPAGTTTGTFINTNEGTSEKMFVPGGVEITFTLVENADGSLTVSYTVADEEVIVPTLNLDHPSLSFEGEIMYNLYFTADDVTSVEEMGLIAFSTKNTEGTIENAENVYPGYIEAGGMYMSQTAGVPARYLGDAVYFKAYAKLSDGSYVYSGMVGYNAVVYAKSILKNSSNDYMKRLVVAMINYGAEAQAYFCGKEGVEYTPMNSFLTADQQAMINAYDASMVADLIAVDSNKVGMFTYNTGDFAKRTNSVSFDGAFAINYYFTAKGTPDNGMKFYYWNTADYLAADVLTPENATGSMDMVAGSGNQYWGQVSGIAAKEVDQTYFVAGVYELDGVTYTTGILAYSLGKYCAKLAAGTTEQQALSAATAVYGYYAKEYFANI